LKGHVDVLLLAAPGGRPRPGWRPPDWSPLRPVWTVALAAPTAWPET